MQLGDYEIAWVDSEVGKTENDMLSLQPLSTEPPPPHKSVLVGDLKMANFKQFLADNGVQVPSPSLAQKQLVSDLIFSISMRHKKLWKRSAHCARYTKNELPVTYFSQVEFAGGALRCGEYVTLRKVGDASHKVSHACRLIILI